MLQLFEGIDLNPESAVWMAGGMRALAACDGFHMAELALIDEFERGLGLSPSNGDDFDARTCPFDSTEAREVFVRSVQLMSLADGRRSSLEDEWINRTCDCLNISEDRKNELEREAKKFLLSSLAGVTAFRDQAVGIGESLGLSSADIDEVLG